MLKKIFSMYSRRTIAVVGVLVVALAGYNINSLFTPDATEESNERATKFVDVAPIGSLATGSARNYVGTIQAVNQAQIQAEAGGRVTSVAVAVGDVVQPGQIIAQLENAAQRAALTQAEGAYEAALASTEQGNQQSDSALRNTETSLTSSRNQAVTAVRSAYNTSNNTLITVIDQFYANPQGAFPTVRINGVNTNFMRNERVALQSIMSEWQSQLATISATGNVSQVITVAITRTERVLGLLNELLVATTAPNADVQFQGQPLSMYTANLSAERANLTGVVQNLKTIQTSLTAAEEAVVRAQIGDDTTSVSLTAAQVKQSLGALQAAQANLAKTVIRSPIAGTVNSLSVSVGDFVGNTAPVAEVINDSAYEITIYVTADERSNLNAGDMVTVNDSFSGTISSIAPAIDSTTQKIAVKIGLESTAFLSGTTATVSLHESVQSSESSLHVPLTAIAFSLEDGALLTVVDGVVTPIPVTLGQIRGGYIGVSGEITADTEVITDARGLIVGSTVTTN